MRLELQNCQAKRYDAGPGRKGWTRVGAVVLANRWTGIWYGRDQTYAYECCRKKQLNTEQMSSRRVKRNFSRIRKSPPAISAGMQLSSVGSQSFSPRRLGVRWTCRA